MKKVVIPIIILFAAVFSLIIYSVAISQQKIQYENRTVYHILDAADQGELIAEYNGVKTKVEGRNIFRIKSVLTVSARVHQFRVPEYDSDSAITLKFGDGATYIIAPIEPDSNDVYILYSYKKRKSYMKIEGYNSFKLMKDSISPEGLYNKNTIIE